MADLQRIGNQALQNAPQPLRRALNGLGIQFREDHDPAEPMAGGLGPDSLGMIAGVEKGRPSTISVMQPDVFTKNADQLATHEGVHSWQNNLPPAIQRAIPADNPKDPYNYGGTGRIANLVKSGGTLLDLPREQQAAAMQYGQTQGMPEPYNALAHTMDKIPLSQVDMTDPMAKTMNMHPRSPQVPPSSVPGMNFAKEIYRPGQPAPGDMPDLGVAPIPKVMLGMPDIPVSAAALPDLPEPSQPNVRTLNPLERNIDSDQQRLQKVRWHQDNPYGSANNHPGTLGKIAHVLSVAGNIAGNIVAPNVMANIPGSQLSMQMENNGLTHRLNEEQEEQSQNNQRDAGTQATQLANANEPQKAKLGNELTQSEIDKNNAEAQPKPVDLAHAYGVAVQRAIAAGQDPSKDPVVQHLSDAIVALQPGQNKPDAAPKTIDVVPPGSKNPHTMGWDTKTGKFDIDEGEHYEKPTTVNVNAGIAGLDRETKQFGTPHQKAIDSVNAQLEKIADARAMINGNAEAQGLGIPKVLTALVGGQGTGVRITQAELASIAHARGLSGDVEGTLNKWAGKGALSHAQQQQLTQIMDDVKARLVQKQAIASEALDTINGASSREQIIQADKDARKKLSALETGGGSSGSNMQQFTVNGKSYNIPANMVEEFKRDHPNAR